MKARNLLFVSLTLFLLTLACNLPLLGTPSPEPLVVETVPLPAEDLDVEETPQNLFPSLHIEKVQYQPGEVIHVQFTAPADFPTDAWIGIVPSDTPHGSEEENDAVDLQYEHLDGRSSGLILFNAPEEPGSYDIRMFDSDSAGQEQAFLTFEVVGAPIAITNARCRGVTFSYDESLAVSVNCEVVPATPRDQDGPYWDIYPEHDRIAFVGYPLRDTFHDPLIYVFPIAEYEEMSDIAANTISELRLLLSGQPQNPDNIPSLPVINAGQIIHTKISYLNFQNGSGVRFLTQYAQAASPIDNQDLIYSFQGITNDDRFYVSAIFPVNHPNLPATSDEVPGGDWDAFFEDFENYLIEIQAEINANPPESFNPNLILLDELIQSLLVEQP